MGHSWRITSNIEHSEGVQVLSRGYAVSEYDVHFACSMRTCVEKDTVGAMFHYELSEPPLNPSFLHLW
jgi:hypothetical protein